MAARTASRHVVRLHWAISFAVTAMLAACGGGGEEAMSASDAAASGTTPEMTALGAQGRGQADDRRDDRNQSRCVRFEFTALGSLGGTQSAATAINDSGSVVGYGYLPGDTKTRAVLWVHGRPVDLGTLGGADAYAYDINDSGKVVGTSATRDGTFHATLWSGGKVVDLGLAGGLSSGASSINDQGQIVGGTSLGKYQGAVVLWNGKGQATQLTGLGGQWITSSAAEINDKGQIAGTAATNYFDNHQAMTWNRNQQPSALSGVGDSFAYGMNNRGTIVGVSGANPTTIGVPTVWNGSTATVLAGLHPSEQGRPQGFATAVNDAGVIVGASFTTANGDAHAVIWRGSEALDLNDFLDMNDVGAGWVLTGASGINNNGSIVGSAYNSRTQRTQAYVLNPSVERGRNGGAWSSKHSGRLCDIDL